MKDILLTHAYYLNDDPVEQKIMKPYPPLGLLSVGTYLDTVGLKTEIFDSTFSSFNLQLNYIIKHKPRFIGIYVNLMTKVNAIKLIAEIKAVKGYSPTIFLGGPDLRYNIENYLNNGADVLIIGEGEQTTEDLINAIASSKELSEVEGIAFKNGEEIIITKERQKIKNIDELPIPDRTKIDLQKYLDVWKKYHGASSVNLSTQRGCPYTCKWCSTAVYGQSYRRRDVKLVVDEIQQLLSQYSIDNIWFVDDVFTVSHKWIDAFHEEMMARNVKVGFELITRAERLNPSILKKLKEIGCKRIWIGAESGSQSVIDRMDRRVDVTIVRDRIMETRKLGIEAGTFIMLGYPGETIEDINETIKHLSVSQPDQFTITIAYPIKGTSLYNEIEDIIIDQPNWTISTDRQIDFKRTYPRAFYPFAVSRVVNESKWRIAKSKGLSHAVRALPNKAKSIRAKWKMKPYLNQANR